MPRGSVILITSAVINSSSFDIAASTPPLKGCNSYPNIHSFAMGQASPESHAPVGDLKKGAAVAHSSGGKIPYARSLLHSILSSEC